MKKFFSTKRILAAVTMLCAVSVQSYADDFNNVWVKALTYPSGAGTVFVDWYLDEVNLQSTSEFKRAINFGASNAFIVAEANDGWMFAGVARDMDMNGQYSADKDKQIHVFYNNFFTAYYDHTNFHGQSSSEAQELAEEALKSMKKPTDQVIAVFSKGAVASRAEDEEAFGYVYCSNLANEPGDQVTFYAYADYDSRNSPNVYYKFDSWLDASGQEVSRNREFTITVTGMEHYYAHFVKTTKKDWEENEKAIFPDRYKFDYNNQDWNPSEWVGISELKADLAAGKAIYDLQGRRVEKTAKGVFIQNGKKMIVK